MESRNNPELAAKLVKIMTQHKKLYALISRADHVKYGHLTDSQLQALDQILAKNETLFNVVKYASHHPTLDDVLALNDSGDLPKLTKKLKLTPFQKALNKENISSDYYLEVIRGTDAMAKKLNMLIDAEGFGYLLASNLITIHDLAGLTEQQATLLANEKIQNLIAPAMDMSFMDFNEAPILSFTRAITLTNAELNKLAKDPFYAELRKRNISVEETLNLNPNMSKGELSLHILKKAEQAIIFKKLLPNLNPEEQAAFSNFSTEFVNTYIINERKDENVQAILALNDQERAALLNVKPAYLLNLFFKYNTMTLREVLALTKDERAFIVEAVRNNILADQIKAGGFRQLYEASRERMAPASLLPPTDTVELVEMKAADTDQVQALKVAVGDIIQKLNKPNVWNGKAKVAMLESALGKIDESADLQAAFATVRDALAWHRKFTLFQQHRGTSDSLNSICEQFHLPKNK
tara:strand:+ start:252 stop:1649 length:1398 start_codon:yes stop_codon:yes gene_type:complete